MTPEGDSEDPLVTMLEFPVDLSRSTISRVLEVYLILPPPVPPPVVLAPFPAVPPRPTSDGFESSTPKNAGSTEEVDDGSDIFLGVLARTEPYPFVVDVAVLGGPEKDIALGEPTTSV